MEGYSTSAKYINTDKDSKKIRVVEVCFVCALPFTPAQTPISDMAPHWERMKRVKARAL